MPTIDLLPLVVQVKENWGDSWATVLNVEPIAANIGSGGQVGSFQFRVRYGQIKYPGTTSVAIVDHTQLNRQWVRCLRSPYTDSDILFQGRLELDTRQVYGAASGIQTFTAFDGVQILNKTAIEHSKFWHDSKVNDYDDLLPFNLHQTSLQRTANRSTAEHDDSYVFELDGVAWRVSDAIEYIVEQFVNSSTGPTWTISGVTINDELQPVKLQKNTTALDAIQAFLQSATGYSFVVLPTATGFELKLFSLAISDVTFGSVTVPANPNSVAISNATNPEIELVLEESQSNQYGRVVARGSRMIVCRSFRYQDNELAWEPEGVDLAALETDYLAADDEDRASPIFSNLYCRFVVSTDAAAWPATQHPTLQSDGTVDDTTAAAIPVFSGSLDAIPLRVGNDYENNVSATQVEGEFLPPLLFLENANSKYVEFQSSLIDGELLALPETIGVHVRTPRPHVLAEGFITDAEVDDSEIKPRYKPDTVVLTMAIQTNQRLWRESGTAGDKETKIIDVDGAEFWWLAPDTALETVAGAINHYKGTGEPIRDDGEKLERIVAGGMARYLTPRGKASGRARGLFAWHLDIGKVVTTDDPDIESVLTSVFWTFENEFTTRFQTGFAI